MGLSSNRFCLNGLAGGHRGGPCTRRSQHTSTLSLGVWLRVGVARVVRAQSASQVSDPSSEKSCNFFETQVESKTRVQRQCLADLQPFRHDEEYLRCRIRYRIRYRILYIVYDIVGIHDVVYDIISCTSYTTSYTISYAISFLTTPEIYSACLTALASRLRFRVSAPLRLES